MSPWHQRVLLTLSILAAGATGPWWLLIAPAFIYGLWQARPSSGLTSLTRLVVTTGACASVAWLIPSAIQDLTVGFRISHRLAGLGFGAHMLGTHGTLSVFAWFELIVEQTCPYFLTALVAALMTSLAATIGWTAGWLWRDFAPRYAADQKSTANRQGD